MQKLNSDLDYDSFPVANLAADILLDPTRRSPFSPSPTIDLSKERPAQLTEKNKKPKNKPGDLSQNKRFASWVPCACGHTSRGASVG